MELISRQQAIDALRKMRTYKMFSGDDMLLIDQAGAQTELMLLPPIQPKRGKWIDKGEHGDWEWHADGRGQHWHEWECNTCHHYFEEISFFCPYCGSDMREVTT